MMRTTTKEPMSRYNNDPREMTARFASTCRESGKPIKKGDPIIYWPIGKSVYLIGSAPAAEADFRKCQAAMHEEDNGYCSY